MVRRWPDPGLPWERFRIESSGRGPDGGPVLVRRTLWILAADRRRLVS